MAGGGTRETSPGAAPRRRRVLFVSRIYPGEFDRYRAGVFVRMHVWLEALRANTDELCVLFFLRPPADVGAEAAMRAREALARRWGIDAEVVLAESAAPPTTARPRSRIAARSSTPAHTSISRRAAPSRWP
jgi:hypothetical protein